LFAVPQERVLASLQKVLKLKYTAVLMYMNYGDRVRSHFRDTVYDHFQAHMLEEREACYDLAMKITALGGEPEVQVTKVPSTASMAEMFMWVMQAEKTLILQLRELLAVCGDNAGLRVLLENMVLADQRHLDDARRMSVPLL
jgi:bacterioferritin (cytochrome b1)